MKIPNCNKAFVDLKKLKEYCLNESHPVGKHKAKIFQSVLGISLNDAEELKTALLDAAIKCDAIPGEEDRYGKRYTIDFIFSKFENKATIRSCWIVLNSENFPRLTTCYINVKPGAKLYEL